MATKLAWMPASCRVQDAGGRGEGADLKGLHVGVQGQQEAEGRYEVLGSLLALQSVDGDDGSHSETWDRGERTATHVAGSEDAAKGKHVPTALPGSAELARREQVLTAADGRTFHGAGGGQHL